MNAGVLDSSLIHNSFQAIAVSPLKTMLILWKRSIAQRDFCGKVVYLT